MANATTNRRISQTPGVVGGNSCIRDTRIPVWTLVQLKKLGRAEDDLISDFPGLTDSHLEAAWDCYRMHTVEIEQTVAAEGVLVGN